MAAKNLTILRYRAGDGDDSSGDAEPQYVEVTALDGLPVRVVADDTVVTPRRTYRTAFSIAAVAGDAVELCGRPSVKVRLTEIAIAKPSGAQTVTVVRRLSADTGGTSTNASAFLAEHENTPPVAQVKLYTAAPTAGTQEGTALTCVVAATDVFIYDFVKTNDTSPVVLPGESIAINVDASTTLPGWIEWTEEAL